MVLVARTPADSVAERIAAMVTVALIVLVAVLGVAVITALPQVRKAPAPVRIDNPLRRPRQRR